MVLNVVTDVICELSIEDSISHVSHYLICRSRLILVTGIEDVKIRQRDVSRDWKTDVEGRDADSLELG